MNMGAATGSLVDPYIFKAIPVGPENAMTALDIWKRMGIGASLSSMGR